MRPDVVRGHLDLILLGVLARGPAHGYAVITAVRETTGGDLELTEGAVYPALHRLEDRGLLAGDWDRAGGRRRRVYSLTAAGEQALRTEHAHWRSLVGVVDGIVGGVLRTSVAAGPVVS